MKIQYQIIIIVLAFCIYSCKDNSTNPDIFSTRFHGFAFVQDSNDVFYSNHSGIKVTIIKTGEITYTDSLGHYIFNNIRQGLYSFSFDYGSFAKFFVYDIAISNPSDTMMNWNYWPTLGPRPTHSFELDSIHYGSSSDSNKYNIYFHCSNPIPKRYYSNLFLFSKTADSLDYHSGKYLYVTRTIRYFFNSTANASSWHTFTYDYLKSYGFNKGDSIYVKFYALGSVDFYISKETNKPVFPYIGNESNALASKLK